MKSLFLRGGLIALVLASIISPTTMQATQLVDSEVRLVEQEVVLVSDVKEKDDLSQQKLPSLKKNNSSYKKGQVIYGKATHYCACSKCNPSYSGYTASGFRVKNGMKDPHIVACNWLPIGAVIRVNGVKYTVADRGGSGLSAVGRIDIFTPGGHEECFRRGAPSVKIKIISV